MAVLTYRSVKGSALTVVEMDNNIHNLDDRITEIEDNPVDPVVPTSIGMTGTSFTMGLSNGTTLGPITFTIPMPQFRGPWTALTSYQQLNFFIAPDGALGVVMNAHVSEATFSWDLEVDTSGDLAYRSISGSATGTFAGLSDVLFTDLQVGDVLTWDADLEKWVNAAAAGGGTGNVVNNGGATTGNIPIFADEYGEEIYDSGYSINDLKQQIFWFAVGDETTNITTGTSKLTFRMPCWLFVQDVRASLSTESSSGVVTVDMNVNGGTALSTKLTIDATERTSTTAVTPAVLAFASFPDDAEITIDIDTAGTGAKGLKIMLRGIRLS